jgi:3-hydroxybutyryl-CoA dehydrogenase
MPTIQADVAVIGAGRMGRGIALSYAFAGTAVLLVDLKPRTLEQRRALQDRVVAEIRHDLGFLVSVQLLQADKVDAVLERIGFAGAEDAAVALGSASIIYEGVPERIEAKQQAFAFVSEHAAKDAIIASTTSTFLVSELADMVSGAQRFINAHWLNPAHLMPLVELSRTEVTSDATVAALKSSLESIGKVPVVCSASAGYIVPRIQALAMNEAARLVEEGVASAEDVDKAIRIGFGLRFSVLGMLEFIDWGGGDILYYASDYLSGAVGERFEAPGIIVDNMHNGRNGIADGKGFYDYADVDVAGYRNARMLDFVAMLRNRSLLPVGAEGESGTR